MKQSLLLGAVLHSCIILAAPHAKKTKHAPFRSRPLHPHEKFTTSMTMNSQNSIWSGGILHAVEGQTYTGVSATFAIPTASIPYGGGPGSYAGGGWVGIDGTEGYGGLWQAGAAWTADNSAGGDPVASYNLWYEWYPAGSVPISNFPVSAGDIITVNLTSQSPSSGTVVFTDQTTGQTAQFTVSAPDSSSTLPGQSVEWVTEDPTVGSGPASFAAYGSVSYTNCGFASTTGSGDATGAELVDLVSNGVLLSQASQPSGSEIDTTYG